MRTKGELSPSQHLSSRIQTILQITGGGLIIASLAWTILSTTDSSNLENFVVNGDASHLGGGFFELTPAWTSKEGSIWYGEAVSLSEVIELEFDMTFGSKNNGGHGMTILFHQDPDGLATHSSTGGGQSMAVKDVTPSVGIKFDTYQTNGWGDPADDHIAIFANGDVTNLLQATVCASPSCADIEDGSAHTILFSWDPTTTTATVSFDGNQRLSYTGDWVTDIFSGDDAVYMGFTGATGGTKTRLTTEMVDIVVTESSEFLPVEWAYFDGKSSSGGIDLEWGTSQELNSDFFAIERSTDGAAEFVEIGLVSATGTTQEASNYTFQDSMQVNQPQTIHYRLRQVDLDGVFAFSRTVAVQVMPQAGTKRSLKVFPNPASTEVSIQISEGIKTPSTLRVLDITGKTIFTQTIAGRSQQFELDVRAWAAGTYIVSWQGGNDLATSKLIVR